MVKFLKDCRISNDVVDEIIKENSSANLYNLSCNQEEVVKIIHFFEELGVICIEDLLKYRIDIFFQTLEDIKIKFSTSNSTDIVKSINEDYTNIDEL